ncbi:nuclear transport factor 2 family protein [Catenulispora pinisilvae]|uniref:nuclear transport factor 2 family protein n=1 Tax=Catenulispora pinisilvae TaxID=2705253 RepID=UPI0018911E26|nr:nuclear transport factor 2 family protein [Catenulispora pinisilvae]
MMPTSELVDPAVRAFIDALNANDPAAVQAAMTENATMTDDGTPRQLGDWLEREAFETHGRMDVTQQSPDGRDLLVDYTNDQWGTMATRWHFEVLDQRVAHFDTGQAPAAS